MLVLGVLWWSWVGYAWLTSVVDPEEGAVRIAIFGAMAALLIVSLCVPEAFGGLALEFALAYGVVRADRSCCSCSPAATTRAAALGDGSRGRHRDRGRAADRSVVPRRGRAGGLWALALLLDMGDPFVFGSQGWKLSPATSPSATG